MLIPITRCSISLWVRLSCLFSSLRRAISDVMCAILLEAWSIQFFTSKGMRNSSALEGVFATVFFAGTFLVVATVYLLWG